MEAEQDFYDFLVEYGIATEDELDLVTNCYGFTIDTFERVLYYREGVETMEQYLGIEAGDDDWEEE